MRLANHDDLPAILEMSVDYYDEMRPVWPYSADGVKNTISHLINSPDGYVAIGNGFIAGVKSESPISPGWIVASEVMWWGDAMLFRGFREWASDADEIRYSCPPRQERVCQFFERRGSASEIIFSEV